MTLTLELENGIAVVPDDPAEYHPLICQDRLSEFVREFWSEIPGAGKLIWNWHMDVLCDELQTVAERLIAGLPKEHDTVFNISPGTSKSSICSILFPAWLWTRMPHARILTASHTSDLALDLAAKSRDVVRSEKYRAWFPDIDIREDTDSKGHYRNSHGGERKVCTVSGVSPMGFHAHAIIVDDPIDPKKVLSVAELETAKKFVDEVIPSRKVDKLVSVTFLVMQRLGLGDPSDVMLKGAAREGASPVRQVCLPAELVKGDDGAFADTGVEPKELARRYIEGLMDPIRLGPQVLRDFHSRGELYYSTQFLQRPYARSGGMFHEDWFSKRIKAAPYKCRRVRSWDRAQTESGGCATAGTLLGMDEVKALYVEDVVKGHWAPDQRNAMILATALRDRIRYGPKYEPIILVENEGGSTSGDANLALARKLHGFRVIFEHPTGKKEIRADPWASQLAAGNVWLVDNGEREGQGKATWDINDYIAEHLAFPVGAALKDQVDSSSAGSTWLANQIRNGPAMRTLPYRNRKKNELGVIVCTEDELAVTLIEQQCMLVHVVDPSPAVEEVMCNEASAAASTGVRLSGVSVEVNGGVGQSALVRNPAAALLAEAPPPHALPNLLGHVTLTFAAIDPVDYQDRWAEPIPPWNLPADKLIMSRDDGRKLWGFLSKRRDIPPEVVVFCDDGDGRALSLAVAFCEIMRYPLETIHRPNEEAKVTAAPIKHVADMAKTCRALVM